LNYECIKELANALGYEDPFELGKNTSINRFNYALQYPSNYFVSLKLCGDKAHMIKYNKSFNDVKLDLDFDVKNETMSMFVFGINLNKIKASLGVDKIKSIRFSSKNLNALKEEYQDREIKMMIYAN
jgi:hypothetical protein